MSEEHQQEQEQEQEVQAITVDLQINFPSGKSIVLPEVAVTESLTSIRQALAEYQESIFYTSYVFKYVQTEGPNGEVLEVPVEEYNEFSDLLSFYTETATKITLEIEFDKYDVKKARAQVKRVREVLSKPFIQSANPTETLPTTKKVEKHEIKYENHVDISTSPNFFQEIFRAPSDILNIDFNNPPLQKVLKNVYFSGWNPVPPQRKLQGDLLYIEAVFETQGTIYITASAKGFYVNKSNRSTFDPTPAPKAYFSHTLFGTLLGVSTSLRTAWVEFCQKSTELEAVFTNSSALDHIISTFKSFNNDLDTLPANTWILPSKNDPFAPSSHSYDMLRVQSNLGDLHGADELGIVREWNDEIQSIRKLSADDLPLLEVKSRLEHRIITEFTESCKKIAIAISDGLISPLTYSDPTQAEIYVYNSIFFSRAEDTKDNFGLISGQEATRKTSGRDLYNQKLLRALNIEGLGTVLCTIVDYKGIRYVGQSIIPGIFSQGDNSAYLLYGIMDKTKPLSVKNSSFSIMEKVAKAFYLAKRNVSTTPFGIEEKEKVVKGEHLANDPVNQLLQTASENESSPIKIDDVDNVQLNADGSVPHYGPIEAKLIQGSDGRTYTLEVIRLSPRDANFVKGNGTKKISDDLLSNVDDNIAKTYLIRQELINAFLQRKVMDSRQKLIQELKEKKKLNKPKEEKKEKVRVEDEDETQIVKDENNEEDVLSKEDLAEIEDAYSAITIESLNYTFNPNVFFDFDSDVSKEIVEKDEEVVRELSSFIIDFMLPFVTRQAREGDNLPKDNNVLVKYLHKFGINMRYLGLLANLALEQEREDASFMLQSKQRINSMPYTWFELIIIEIIARSSKHALNQALRSNADVSASPASSVSSLLNAILSLIQSKDEESSEKTKKAENVETVTSVDKKAKKADKKAAVAAALSAAIPEGFSVVESIESFTDAFANREETVSKLLALMKERFLNDSPLVTPYTPTQSGEEDEATAMLNKFFSPELIKTRINPITLVRRVAQQCGIIITSRNYNFNTPNPFTPADIIALVPKVKSCEPDIYIPEFDKMLTSSEIFLQQGDAVNAYKLAQQAHNLASQITGPIHPMALKASTQISSVLSSTGDSISSAHAINRTIGIASQVEGIDSNDAYANHVQLAVVLADAGDFQGSLDELFIARYLLTTTSGYRHPDLANIYIRIAFNYQNLKMDDAALKSFVLARSYSHDVIKTSMINTIIADFCFSIKKVHQAVIIQKQAFGILQEVLNPEDERLINAKQKLETYIRAQSQLPQVEAEEIEQINNNKIKDAIHDAVSKKKNNKKKSNKKK